MYQGEPLGKPADLFIPISASGNSTKVIRVVGKISGYSIFTIGLMGRDEGKLKNLVELHTVVPSDRACFCSRMLYYGTSFGVWDCRGDLE